MIEILHAMNKKPSLLCALLIFIYLWRTFTNRKTKAEVMIEPSYVIAVKGNIISLYSEVRGVAIYDVPTIILTNSSILKSKKFHFKKKHNSKIKSKWFADLHIWDEICHDNLQSLLHYPLFPHLPSSQTQIDILNLPHIESDVGIRIYGFIMPQISSEYIFQLSLVGVEGEMWLSTSHNVNNAMRLLHGFGYHKEVTEIHSKSVSMTMKQKYYFEILVKSGTKYGSFSLKWKTPVSKFDYIDNKFLLSYLSNNPKNDLIDVLNYSVPINSVLMQTKKDLNELYEKSMEKRKNIYLLPFMDEKDTKDLFPVCKYSPSYLMKNKIDYNFKGIWETHFSSVFPQDHTDIRYKLQNYAKTQTIFGNPVIDENTADDIAAKVIDAIYLKHGSKYTFVSVLNIEENNDAVNGKRYLVELELSVKNHSDNVRFSEYVYQPISSSSLCYPVNFKWNKNADVNVVLTVGNQDRWAKHFIDTMSRIYKDTKDKNLNVIIVDFDSKAFDIARALKESSLPRYTLLKRSGQFHKTEAIQAAINTIDNLNAITMQLDLHLIIPSDIIDNVRKHTIQGRMTYSPILARLQCGYNPQNPRGFWEITGYGIFGIYKSDWDAIGGMDIDRYRNKWGGEDWNLLDRVLNAGYEVERLKLKNFYHVFHSKKKMWRSMT